MTDPASIGEFIEVTGADTETAAFYLSAANGNCEAAISEYFESGGAVPTSNEATDFPPPPTSTPAQPVAPPTARPAPAQPSTSSSDRPSTSSAASHRSGRAPRSSSRPSNQRFATLGSLERERDDDEKGYYAGGQRSGQMIQDPRDNNESRNSGNADENADDSPPGLINAIFDRARARGPRPDSEREHFEGPQRFAGAGYRLGDTAGRVEQPTVIGRRNVTRVLTFYANGFQVDDGPLRALDDPANEAFLADVNRGVVPREMEEPGVGDVSITLIDKKGENYVADPNPVVPFSGGGQRLDGGSGPLLPRNDHTRPLTPGSGEGGLNVDESRPTTRVQIRLFDGTRLVATLNVDHTVGQLRQFIRSARPSMPNFVLATTFPKKVLDDDAKTIKEAGLMGAVVIQSLV